jgi:hypothetical protein
MGLAEHYVPEEVDHIMSVSILIIGAAGVLGIQEGAEER